MDAPRAHNGAVDNEMNDEQLVCYPPRCDNAVTSAVFSSVCLCVGRSVCVCVCSFVDATTFEPFEISSCNVYKSKISFVTISHKFKNGCILMHNDARVMI